MSGYATTQEEIWDDSALVDSWNEALEEYKKYHSIAARGEQVEEVVQNFEESDGANLGAGLDAPASTKGDATSPTHNQRAKASTGPADMAKEPPASMQSKQSHSISSCNADVHPAAQANLNGAQVQEHLSATSSSTAVPETLISSVKDEGMKNLMMSWYYAGYYTGLQEGQQKAYTNMEAHYARGKDSTQG